MAIPLPSLDPRRSRRPLQNQQDQGNAFQYSPLSSQNTFRLLKLHAGRGDRIDCSIHHFLLGSGTRPTYRAISYTWGKDAARFDIHLPGDAVIKVRDNLRNALRSVRDQKSDCWLWIDAICIDQSSDDERNHQVRLMADIYGNANVVLVWLQSAGESADVARAFKFVHAAATYKSNEHSIWHYCKAHTSDSEKNWRSVQALCRLRYWTRKWIIQELVSARTVVLQAGNSTCSMADFETLCRQLHRNRGSDAYKDSAITSREIWNSVIGSPAVRLALQRSERRGNQQPGLLHELMERYASNQCHLPCDHVYALYSLVGPHRRHFDIDYGAQPVERLVAVLDFVQSHEQLRPEKALEFATLLMKLLKIREEELSEDRGIAENLDVAVEATLLGTVGVLPESEASIAMRRKIRPLRPMPVMSLDTSQNLWRVTGYEDPGDAETRIGRQDMIYFSIIECGFHGLAACRVEDGDTIWHLPKTQLVIAVRASRGPWPCILGRAYLFKSARDPDSLQPWIKRPFEYNGLQQGKRQVSMNLVVLLELGSLLNMSSSWMVRDVKAVSKRNRRFKALVAGCGRLFFPMHSDIPWYNRH